MYLAFERYWADWSFCYKLHFDLDFFGQERLLLDHRNSQIIVLIIFFVIIIQDRFVVFGMNFIFLRSLVDRLELIERVGSFWFFLFSSFLTFASSPIFISSKLKIRYLLSQNFTIFLFLLFRKHFVIKLYNYLKNQLSTLNNS